MEKTQVMVESTFGDSHPGSAHLLCLVEAAAAGVRSAGGNPARYFATDICDGMAQGHDGINYSLASREIIADAIEIHGMATPFDATVYIASCDKGLPANLMASGRLNTPGIFVPGGVMDAGPDLLTLEQIGTYSAQYERGEITAEQFRFYKTHALSLIHIFSFRTLLLYTVFAPRTPQRPFAIPNRKSSSLSRFSSAKRGNSARISSFFTFCVV